MKEIQNEKENLMASNNSMAEFNLSKEPELVEGREKLQELSELGEELTKRVEEKMKELSKLCKLKNAFTQKIKIVPTTTKIHTVDLQLS